jgi:hypothetical protein
MGNLSVYAVVPVSSFMAPQCFLNLNKLLREHRITWKEEVASRIAWKNHGMKFWLIFLTEVKLRISTR